jgi:hypothetical protein
MHDLFRGIGEENHKKMKLNKKTFNKKQLLKERMVQKQRKLAMERN